MASTRVQRSTKLAYGLGQVADAIKINTFEIFLFFYYNQVLGLSGTLTGLAVFLALCADAINDPVFGSVSDNLHSRWGRRHPLMYLAVVPTVFAYFGLFSPPDGLSDAQLFAWLLFFCIFLRSAVSLYYVPYLALGTELSSDYQQRSSIVSFRTTFGLLGSSGLIILSFSYFFRSSENFASGQLDPTNYPAFALFFALVMGLSIFLTAAGTHPAIKHLHQHLQSPNQNPKRFKLQRIWREFSQSLHNHAFRVLMLSITLILIMAGIQNALTLHVLTYFWEFSNTEILITIMAFTLGQLAGVPFVGFLHHRLERKWILILGALWSMTFHLIPVSCRLLDLLPANGDPSIAVLLSVCWLLSGMGSVQCSICAGTMIADISDDHELKTHRNQAGIFFGGFSLSIKTSLGVGHALAGIIIDIIKFPANAQQGMVDQSILFQLGLLYAPVTGLIGCVGIMSLLYYRLTRKQIEENRQQLNIRHSTSHPS